MDQTQSNDIVVSRQKYEEIASLEGPAAAIEALIEDIGFPIDFTCFNFGKESRYHASAEGFWIWASYIDDNKTSLPVTGTLSAEGGTAHEAAQKFLSYLLDPPSYYSEKTHTPKPGAKLVSAEIRVVNPTLGMRQTPPKLSFEEDPPHPANSLGNPTPLPSSTL